MEEVAKNTAAEFEDADESELERRLTAMGVGTEPEQLYEALNDSEKAAFSKLVDQMHYSESGFGDSVFRSKR
ncbi:unnamed protein product [Anisakis simplex]|uniref:Uncharacterized protein n=1 Tax=Anisakis simplex TaxID=6269 RepID=A0A3P6PHJ9_ANISI|nr:unnamed protein product [Anisakis simplex]